jgi:hypothetical protein
MTPSDLGYEFHTYHPRLLRQKHRIVTQLRGGKYSMLISMAAALARALAAQAAAVVQTTAFRRRAL